MDPSIADYSQHMTYGNRPCFTSQPFCFLPLIFIFPSTFITKIVSPSFLTLRMAWNCYTNENENLNQLVAPLINFACPSTRDTEASEVAVKTEPKQITETSRQRSSGKKNVHKSQSNMKKDKSRNSPKAKLRKKKKDLTVDNFL